MACALDRNKPGMPYTNIAIEWNKHSYLDNSGFYRNHKDLYDWFIYHKQKFLYKSIIKNLINEQIKTKRHGRI